MSEKRANIDDFVKQGRGLLRETDVMAAHREFNTWVDSVGDWLAQIAPDSGLSADWASISQSKLVMGRHYYDNQLSWVTFQTDVRTRLHWLGSLGKAIQARRSAKDKRETPVAPSGKVFVVHGRNETARESVARFLEKLDLEPVILHEKPNAGRTIIEKFIDYSDVSFAVILLTGDDIGRLATEPHEMEKSRARQNVILELGFFLGRLGRKNVCAVYESGVDIPSDYQGVLFVELDGQGGWKLLLARELKAAGIPFDMNKALEEE
jgi:predicted nucleotide-binding protein